MQPAKSTYGFSKVVNLPYAQAVERTRGCLKDEGFGVLTEIDLKEKLKEKLGVDFRRYVILGACNPPLAYKTLQEELEIGLLLPCNVIVYETEDGQRTVVSAVDAMTMLSIVGEKPALSAVAAEVNDRLKRVVERV